MLASIITVIGLGLGLGVRAETTRRTEKWQPAVGTSWQIVLQGIDFSDPRSLTPDVEAYDLDLEDNDAEVFAGLQKLGKKVICYFSAGSYEDWRSDAAEFEERDLGSELDGWPGERWLDISSPRVRAIMAKRIKLASQKGCDAIDPDNVDGFQNENGLNLTPEDSTSFVKFLSAEAAKYNLAVGLKNAGDIIPDVLSCVDFAVNEECAQWDECDTFAQFIEDGKPVFQIEYPDNVPNIAASAVNSKCDAAGTDGFSTVLKNLDLDGWVQYCDGTSYDTAI